MKINFLKSRSVAEPKQNIGNYRGFTLIEMLISVTLFTFVGLMAVSTLVSSQQLNNNQKAVRLLYDNMYFTMEEIARELRQGNSYSLISDGILFKPYQPFAGTPPRLRAAPSPCLRSTPPRASSSAPSSRSASRRGTSRTASHRRTRTRSKRSGGCSTSE